MIGKLPSVLTSSVLIAMSVVLQLQLSVDRVSCAVIDVDSSITATTHSPEIGEPDKKRKIFSKIHMSLVRSIYDRNPLGSEEKFLDTVYHGGVNVGTPGQLFSVVFDTSTADSFFPRRSKPENFMSTNWFYNPNDSLTKVAVNNGIITINHREMSLIGETFEDIVTVYDNLLKTSFKRADKLEIPFKFLAAQDLEVTGIRRPFESVVGLAPFDSAAAGSKNLLMRLVQVQKEYRRTLLEGDRSLEDFENSSNASLAASEQQVSQIDAAADDSEVAQPVASFWFSLDATSPLGSELVLGGIDERRFEPPLVYFQSLPTGWAVGLSFVKLGAHVFSCPNGCRARFDSGSSYITGPKSDVELIYETLGAKLDSGLWLVDCASKGASGDDAQVPPITFTFDGQDFSTPSSNFVYDAWMDGRPVCYLAIRASGQHDWTLGTSFLKAYYSVFDFGSRRVGLAQRKD